jgi:hypothetical protein
MTAITFTNAAPLANTALGPVEINIENCKVTLGDTWSVDRVFLHTPSRQGLQDFSGIENETIREIVEKIDRDIPGSIFLVELDGPAAFTVWIDMGVAIKNGDYPAWGGKALRRNGRTAQCEPLCIEASFTSDKTWNEYGQEMTAAEYVFAARQIAGL